MIPDKSWDNSISFWNAAYEKTAVQKTDWNTLAPSKKQFDAIASLSDCNNLLDYGCGSGWASIIAAKCGCRNVMAVDVAESAIKLVEQEAVLYHISRQLHVEHISETWLQECTSGIFDGLFSSNVLDVIPEEMTDVILKEFHRILKQGGKAVISLNYYADLKADPEKHIKVSDGKYLFIDDVLRLLSLSDKAWIKKLERYFEIVDLQHYAWPGEKEERRRLFILRKRCDL